MKAINFSITVDEANLILEGLGHIPFARVYALVAKIQDQAQQQINGETLSAREPGAEIPAPVLKERAHAG